MVFDLLTDSDKSKIETYRNAYASAWDRKERMVSIEHLLRHWNAAKSKYLESIFGDQLIITKPIKFNEDKYDLWNRMSDLVHKDSRVNKFYNDITSVYHKRTLDLPWSSPEYQQYYFVTALFNDATLTDNKIQDTRFERNKHTFDLPIGDEILKVQKGSKPMRIISKIANAYKIGIEPDEDGVSDFEYFRRKHSLALNQKILTGELGLSIHPLDYMTMSDNDEGWDSCMSWENDGEYKQGTVEMMNSPCVVVGYLASEHNNISWWGSNGEEWNSKKWRSLFIVDKDFIINVRSYPYDNNNLVKEVIKEIARLAGWGEVEPQPYMYLEKWEEHRSKRNPVIINGREVAIDFCTQTMYNDFGCNHYIALNPNETKSIIDYDYNYSGHSMCMWCGGTQDEVSIGSYEGERYLVCGECEESFECSWCGERTSADNVYTTADGNRICSYCWEEHTDIDIISEETYMADNMHEIYLARTNNDDEVDKDHLNDCEMKNFYMANVGSEDWYKICKIDKPRHKIVYSSEYYDDERYYFLPCDLTEEGIREFDLWDEVDLKDYMGENEHN